MADYALGQAQNRPAPPAVLKAVNPSLFGTIEDARGHCIQAANRVEATVNRLCGAYPVAGSNDGERPQPDGLLSAGMEHTADIRASMERIFTALDRLEKHLP